MTSLLVLSSVLLALLLLGLRRCARSGQADRIWGFLPESWGRKKTLRFHLQPHTRQTRQTALGRVQRQRNSLNSTLRVPHSTE